MEQGVVIRSLTILASTRLRAILAVVRLRIGWIVYQLPAAETPSVFLQQIRSVLRLHLLPKDRTLAHHMRRREPAPLDEAPNLRSVERITIRTRPA